MAEAYLRFIAMDPDREDGRPEGVFGAAYDLLERAVAPSYLLVEIRRILDWFVDELPIPDRFTRTRRPHRADTGLCWFKSNSENCVRNIRYLVFLVTECGVPVREVRTAKPGYVFYEDDHQVVAHPVAETQR